MSSAHPVDDLRDWIAAHHRVFVLTGDGCSTASGIPDYRDENGEWKRRPPVMFQAFYTQPPVYRRYWARAYAGWPRFTSAAPGPAHEALAAWERRGTLSHLVTQNVDGLHQRAGSQAVIDLHGRLDVVVCLGCRARTSRASVQAAIAATNPTWSVISGPAPDGDADIVAAAIDSFVAPHCDRCGGLLKPDVVFFGENVPGARYAAAREALARADALLVAGSSLMVYSGYRFAQAMAQAGKPIAAINLGRTRADDLLTLKVTGACADALSFLLDA